MFDFLIHLSLRQRLLVAGVALLLVVYGTFSAQRMPSMSSPISTSPPSR